LIESYDPKELATAQAQPHYDYDPVEYYWTHTTNKKSNEKQNVYLVTWPSASGRTYTWETSEAFRRENGQTRLKSVNEIMQKLREWETDKLNPTSFFGPSTLYAITGDEETKDVDITERSTPRWKQLLTCIQGAWVADVLVPPPYESKWITTLVCPERAGNAKGEMQMPWFRFKFMQPYIRRSFANQAWKNILQDFQPLEWSILYTQMPLTNDIRHHILFMDLEWHNCTTEFIREAAVVDASGGTDPTRGMGNTYYAAYPYALHRNWITIMTNPNVTSTPADHYTKGDAYPHAENTWYALFRLIPYASVVFTFGPVDGASLMANVQRLTPVTRDLVWELWALKAVRFCDVSAIIKHLIDKSLLPKRKSFQLKDVFDGLFLAIDGEETSRNDAVKPLKADRKNETAAEKELFEYGKKYWVEGEYPNESIKNLSKMRIAPRRILYKDNQHLQPCFHVSMTDTLVTMTVLVMWMLIKKYATDVKKYKKKSISDEWTVRLVVRAVMRGGREQTKTDENAFDQSYVLLLNWMRTTGSYLTLSPELASELYRYPLVQTTSRSPAYLKAGHINSEARRLMNVASVEGDSVTELDVYLEENDDEVLTIDTPAPSRAQRNKTKPANKRPITGQKQTSDMIEEYNQAILYDEKNTPNDEELKNEEHHKPTWYVDTVTSAKYPHHHVLHCIHCPSLYHVTTTKSEWNPIETGTSLRFVVCLQCRYYEDEPPEMRRSQIGKGSRSRVIHGHYDEVIKQMEERKKWRNQDVEDED
jgi:hypothetical protein